jgi:hypothetical protein
VRVAGVLALEALVAREGGGPTGRIHSGVRGRRRRGLMCMCSHESAVERNLHASSSSPSVADPAGRQDVGGAKERLDRRTAAGVSTRRGVVGLAGRHGRGRDGLRDKQRAAWGVRAAADSRAAA